MRFKGRGPRRRTRPQVQYVLPEAELAPLRVPVELARRDYAFPRVELPASRPVHADAVLAQLHAADDDTQPIEGLVLADKPQPAHAEGLRAAAYPSVPWLTVGNTLPPRLTAWELELFGREDDVPAEPEPTTPAAEPAPEPDAWQQRLDYLTGFWQYAEHQFDDLKHWAHGKTVLDLDAVGRQSQAMRDRHVYADVRDQGHRMAAAYADGGTAELAGLLDGVAHMIAANALAGAR